MFKRRKPRTLLQNTKELLWPTMGWIRTALYIKHKIARLSDTSQKIALGLAIGAGISFSPFIGTHFIQAGLLSYMLRANFFASLIGTFVGNPWTFPFMWWAAIAFGSFLFQIVGLPASATLPDDITFSIVIDLIKNDPFRIFAPWFVGGYLIAFLSIPLTYILFFNLVNGAKLARKKARERHIHKIAKEVTGQQQ